MNKKPIGIEHIDLCIELSNMILNRGSQVVNSEEYKAKERRYKELDAELRKSLY